MSLVGDGALMRIGISEPVTASVSCVVGEGGSASVSR